MTRHQHPAAHVQAAIARGQGAAAGSAQAKAGHSTAGAAHVQAAIDRGLGRTANTPLGTGGLSPPGSAQMRPPPTPPSAPTSLASTPGGSTPAASHVHRAVDAGRGGAAQAKVTSPSTTIQPSGDYVTYTDSKSPTSPPPPPRWPVFSMSCGDGGDCSLRDLKTGRTRPAGDLYAGFVRVSPGGPVYVSPRPDVGLQGDSHPSIASVTPEERSGRGAIVAAGEVGFLNNQIIGHNDKTGHYRTRRNYWQSGMPMEKFHSFTVDPHEWYRAPVKSSRSSEEE